MRAALAAAVLLFALPGTAFAHDLADRVEPPQAFSWFAGPDARGGADGRVRLVTQPDHGTAAMGLNRYDAYLRAYHRHLASFAMRLPMREAEARARHSAWHEVGGPPAGTRPEEAVIFPLRPGTVPIALPW